MRKAESKNKRCAQLAVGSNAVIGAMQVQLASMSDRLKQHKKSDKAHTLQVIQALRSFWISLCMCQVHDEVVALQAQLQQLQTMYQQLQQDLQNKVLELLPSHCLLTSELWPDRKRSWPMQLMSTTLLKHRFAGLQPDRNCIAAADCCLGADAASIGAGAGSEERAAAAVRH